ncbi:MAG: hypothetical protein KAH20_01950 [Methylococcales bacterium]|nr:hypothetical protein [Methylococcales bacterium]
MTKLQRLIAYSTALLCFSPSQTWAAECATADSSLNIHLACLKVGQESYQVNLTPSVIAPTAWEVKDFTGATTVVGCDNASPELNFQVSCLNYQGKSYKVDFLSKFTPSANLGVYWQLGGVVETTSGAAAREPGWSSFTHPCNENQTDALWWDSDDKTVWVGCGTGSTGRGLWKSPDGGESWGQVAGFMETWRVNGIRRAADNRLYVSGTDTSSKNIVVSFDTTVPVLDGRLELKRTNKITLSFTAEHILVDDAGNAFTDSLTGAGSAYRKAGADGWTGINSGWTSDGSSHQILDMVLFNNKIYGVGSSIAKPPVVFLPAKNASDFYKMTPVDLSKSDELSTIIGEMWGVTVVDKQRVVAVGINQNRNVGLVFASRSNPYDAKDYHKFDVSTIVPNTSSWMRGVCSQGNNVVAVGEKQPLKIGSGLVLLSTDGGISFKNITDSNIKATTVSRCQFLNDGRVAVAGSGGYVGIYTP